MEISIDKILCDIQGRTNNDVDSLFKSLITYGQWEPLIVEGPDEDGYYYLIKGFLRYKAMMSDKSRFKKVKCTVIRGVTSTEERNKLRLIMISTSKKPTGLDQQLVYEELENVVERDRLIPKRKQNRMKKGEDVPQEIRLEYEKKRRSQDALALIYGLEELGDYQGELLRLLKNGDITTIHGDAIKRVTKHPLYPRLNQNQKIEAIEKARKNAKFTDNEAGFIILEQMMKHQPQRNNLDSWIEYICDEMEKVTELLNKELLEMATDIHKKKLLNAMNKLKNQLDWLQEKANNKRKQATHVVKVNSESVTKEAKKNKKQVIIYEKRDGNKMTFHFS